MFGKIALILAIILYLVICGQNIYDGDYPHALAWFAYALANVGFIWYEFSK